MIFSDPLQSCLVPHHPRPSSSGWYTRYATFSVGLVSFLNNRDDLLSTLSFKGINGYESLEWMPNSSRNTFFLLGGECRTDSLSNFGILVNVGRWKPKFRGPIDVPVSHSSNPEFGRPERPHFSGSTLESQPSTSDTADDDPTNEKRRWIAIGHRHDVVRHGISPHRS